MSAPSKSAGKAAPEPKPGVDVGDHVYVHHRGGPCTGRVLSHGAHGVTVHIDGKQHQVKWDKVLGHKRRAVQRYDIVDEGEDGMIVADASGRRRYIATPNDAKEDPMVAKAQRPVLLFTKADPPETPRAGLTKKQLTDKAGHQTTRWVRVDRGGPPAQRGQHVGFENGEHRGHGEVVASGQHGVTVRDRAGGEHRVVHEKVTHHWGGDGAPDQSPHEDDQSAPAATPDEKAKSLFDPKQIDGLPRRAVQPHKTWDDLSAAAPEALQQFKDALGKIGQAMGLRTDKKPDALTPEEWDSADGHLFIGSLKSEKRAREKAEADYDGDYSKLCDIVRGTIAVATLDDAQKALEHIKASGLELAQRPKNRLAEPTDTGYRDLLMVVRLPGGMVAELQVNLKSMQQAKSGDGHKEYDVMRGLQAKYGEAAPSDQWSDEDHAEFYRALKAQKDIYGEAWRRATDGSQAKEAKDDEKPHGNLTKSHGTPSIILMLKGV